MASQNEMIVLKSAVGKGNEPTEANFELLPCPNPDLKDGEIRFVTLFVSVDPYMRGRMNNVKTYVDPFTIGAPLNGSGVGRVIESKSSSYNVGDVLTSQKKLAWPFQKYVVFSEEEAKNYTKLDSKIPEKLVSATIGFLGMPGLTAYFGLIDKGRPTAGETVVISGAAGACGSVAGQVAKIKGLRAIGIVGTEDKKDYIIKELGYDGAVIYKGKSKQQISDEIKALCPNGVDIYYDNVGGEISEAVLAHMNKNGRVPICGQISQYNKAEMDPIPADLEAALKEKNVERGWFMVMQFTAKFDEGWKEMFKWVEEGKMKIKETMYQGLSSVPKAFLGLFSGDNIGKAVVQV
jgi:NADPH-dependent curcumin reductase CurA